MITYDRWTVEAVRWDQGKMRAVWGLLQHHPSLFSDLTRGDFEGFREAVQGPGTLLLEVSEGIAPVGFFRFDNLDYTVDCNAHVVFFDRKPMEKVGLGRVVAKWMFSTYPLRRITAEVPDLYRWTINYAEALGFQREGIRRKAVCMKGQWRDVILMGLLREESYGVPNRQNQAS